MSRPANVNKYSEAEEWMKETFGAGMQDYLRAEDADPVSVAVVEVAKVLKKAGAQKLLVAWRAQDVKSKAGKKAILTVTGGLAVILLQLRLKRPTLITEMGDTFRQLTPTQRKLLGLQHDGEDACIYDRIWSAIQRLIHLVDEFPGRRDKTLTESEFTAMIGTRDPADCAMRRERMFALANALLEGSRLCLPKELRDRSDGNFALDATFVPLYGKAGNRSPKNCVGDRQTANHDGGWYCRDGSHGAVTHIDALALNKADPTAKHKGTSANKRFWGVEIEIARTTANFLDGMERFPLLTVALSFHIPGAIVGEGLRIADSLLERGHKANLFIVDRAYSNGIYSEYAVPLRLRGFKHVFNYREEDLGVQAFDPRGFVQISGSWYLDTVPKVLREADRVILAAQNKYRGLKLNLKADSTLTPDARLTARAAAKKVYLQAEALYQQQAAHRAKSMLKPKGLMADNWTRRYLIPIDSPDYAKWKAEPKAHQGVTVAMVRPVGEEAARANAGGLKHEQYFPWGSDDWRAANGMRNGVESVNRNIKRSQYEDIADAEKRAVRGNTFTYLVVALAAVVENLRKIISFFKNRLAIRTVTTKNKRVVECFWQSDTANDSFSNDGLAPPG